METQTKLMPETPKPLVTPAPAPVPTAASAAALKPLETAELAKKTIAQLNAIAAELKLEGLGGLKKQ